MVGEWEKGVGGGWYWKKGKKIKSEGLKRRVYLLKLMGGAGGLMKGGLGMG